MPIFHISEKIGTAVAKKGNGVIKNVKAIKCGEI